jgi:hypothetical protein
MNNDTKYYQVAAKGERLSIGKRRAQKFVVGRSNRKNMKDLVVKEKYRVKIFIRFQDSKPTVKMMMMMMMMMMMWTLTGLPKVLEY